MYLTQGPRNLEVSWFYWWRQAAPGNMWERGMISTPFGVVLSQTSIQVEINELFTAPSSVLWLLSFPYSGYLLLIWKGHGIPCTHYCVDTQKSLQGAAGSIAGISALNFPQKMPSILQHFFTHPPFPTGSWWDGKFNLLLLPESPSPFMIILF